jgi:hypothetical protein
MPYQRGSGFVGLRDYLNANPEAGQRMGEAIASQVEQQGQAAQSAIDAQAGLIQQQIAAGTPQYAAPDYSGMSRDEAWDAQALHRSTPVAYTGPKDMGNVDALGTQAVEAQTAAQLAGTDAGRAVLMQRSGNAAPTVGGRSLDAALAGRGAGNRLAAASNRFGELQKYLSNAQQGITDKAAAAGAQAAQVQQQIRNEPRVPMPSAPRGVGRMDPTNDLRPIERLDRRGMRPVRKGH